MILLLSSNFSVNVLKFSALFYMYIFLFHDWSFLYVCNLEENLLLSTLILGSVFSDYVVLYGDIVIISIIINVHFCGCPTH